MQVKVKVQVQGRWVHEMSRLEVGSSADEAVGVVAVEIVGVVAAAEIVDFVAVENSGGRDDCFHHGIVGHRVIVARRDDGSNDEADLVFGSTRGYCL